MRSRLKLAGQVSVGIGVVALLAGILLSRNAKVEAQSIPGQRFGNVIFQTAYHYDTSPPLRDMPVLPAGSGSREEREANENPNVGVPHLDQPDAALQDEAVSRKALESPNMPVTTLNFDGVVFPGVSCNCAPPDTDGEVGKTQFVQIVNEGFQVFNKATGASVYGPASIVSLWSGFGGACQNGGAGDPIVLYDQLADRWLISQFATPTGNLPITDECVAVSTTGDATGSYYRYGFHLGSNFFDYPHFGVWPDGYYMSMNVFNSAGTAYLGPQPFAFDRTRMLAGLSASFVTPGATGGSSEDPFLPADLDGLTPPAVGAPETFVEFPGSGNYRLYHMHADFVTPASTTFTLFASPAAAAFTELCPTTRSCIPQSGTTSGLDGIGDRLMFRLAYRNFGDHESVVGNFTVNASGVAGIRWFELRGVTAGPVTKYQESTYQPDTAWRWMGSVAQDHQGNMALGFSTSSAALFPHITYAGRLATDTLNTLAQGEATLFAGTGSQVGTSNRWGDYSDMTVDPVDECTFWYTQEYYTTTASFSWRTRIGNFKFPGCVAREPGADFDHDFRSDRSVFRPSTGAWYSFLSATNTATGVGFGVSTDMDVAADYDGDGKADIAVFRPSTGAWFIVQSTTGTVRVDSWGTSGDIPLAGDVDGDGKADLVVFRPSTGAWWIKKSAGGSSTIGWGAGGDQPLLGDVDGDGKADLIIFRSGGWYILKSGGGATITGFGTTGDIPVPGDFDGDGKTDLAIFRPSTGAWFVSKSSGGSISAGFGTAGDVPIAGDQDGDGKADFLIYRAGAWYSLFSGGGTAAVAFGVPTDKPIGRLPGS